MIDTMAACDCGSRYTEWRDCDQHENDCFVLMCYSCGFDDYDCEEGQEKMRKETK